MGAFVFTSFGIIWAWINYSWFASAYDTDDWLYRLLTVGPAAASSAASTSVTGFSSGSKYVQ
ncbi:low temperature requirement protein A [Dermacoccus barathri]|uniref:low temperature requirement protein A n=1 Tax=Dermacoccus barathri TaxID=322601 RepID=UPI0029D41BB8|nr:low temperature requirement protein A [Dermacoccus barathri]